MNCYCETHPVHRIWFMSLLLRDSFCCCFARDGLTDVLVVVSCRSFFLDQMVFG